MVARPDGFGVKSSTKCLFSKDSSATSGRARYLVKKGQVAPRPESNDVR